MIRKIACLILLIILSMVLLTGCSLDGTSVPEAELAEVDLDYLNSIGADDVSTLKATIPVELEDNQWTFEIKTITQPEDIQTVLDMLQNISLEEVENDEQKGFDVMYEITLEDTFYYVFSGNSMLLNENFYLVDQDEVDKAIKMYQELDYEKEVLE